MTSRALPRSNSAGWVATTEMPGNSLMPASKPLLRSWATLVPMMPWISTTLPLPPTASPSALAPFLPAWMAS